MRKTFSISAEAMTQFNQFVPRRERSRTMQMLMVSFLADKQNELEAIADELETHLDFAMVRADSRAWNR